MRMGIIGSGNIGMNAARLSFGPDMKSRSATTIRGNRFRPL